jgi:hypothetical protein
VGPTWYLEFDATILEEFTRSADITTYPVETGAVLADHYQPQPRAITITGVVSNTPTAPIVALEGNKQDAAPMPPGATSPMRLDIPVVQPVKGPAGIARPLVLGLPSRRLIRGNVERAHMAVPEFAQVLQFTGQVQRVVNMFQALDGLMENKTLVNVLMFDELEFTNMMITNHRTPRTAGAGGAYEFTINLIQITTADSDAAPNEAAVIRKEPKHKPKRDTGKRNGGPPAGVDASRWSNADWYVSP